MFFLEGVSTMPPHEYVDYALCKELGWSYNDLMNTPRFFVERMIKVIGIKKQFDSKRHGGRS